MNGKYKMKSIARIAGTILILIFSSCSGGWKVVSANGPEGRYIQKLAVKDSTMYLFGGKNNTSDGFNDLWKWNGKKWKLLGFGATKRWDHSYVYMRSQDQIFLYGGRTFDQGQAEKTRIDLNDNWVFKDDAWTQLDIPSPERRSSHAMAYSQKNHEVIVFGGRNRDTIFSDTWSFNGTEWTQLHIQGPKKRFGHSLAYDPKSKLLYLFGGFDGKNLLNDLWSFDGVQWIEIKTENGPSSRMAHAMEFDLKGNAILFGGWCDTNSVSNELWFWTNGKWTLGTTNKLPEARLSHTIGYDSMKKEFILFGGSTGFDGEFLKKTWRLKMPKRINQ